MSQPSKRKLTQILSDALMHEAMRQVPDPDDAGQIRQQIQRVARSIFRRAIAGDMTAAALIGDRLEGKAVTPIDVTRDTRLTVTLAGLLPRDSRPVIDAQVVPETAIEAAPVADAHDAVPSVPAPMPPDDHMTAHDALRARILASLADE